MKSAQMHSHTSMSCDDSEGCQAIGKEHNTLEKSDSINVRRSAYVAAGPVSVAAKTACAVAAAAELLCTGLRCK